MEQVGFLKGRWIDNPKGKGPKKHLYSLREEGKKEFRQAVKESIDVLVDGYVQLNNAEEDLDNYTAIVKSTLSHLSHLGVPFPTRSGTKVVAAIPYPDPLVCGPLYFETLSRAVPGFSVYIVKPPDGKLDLELCPNVTVLDGWRHNMPFKDGFADYLALQGFPKEVSEEETILECTRVLKDDGHLLVHVSNVMTEEKKPRYTNFAEFALKLLYDLWDFDRIISVNHVKHLLSESFRVVNDVQVDQLVIFHATGKRLERASERVVQRAKKPEYSHVRSRYS